MIFSRNKDPKKVLRVGETIFEKFLKHPFCTAMNQPKVDEINRKGEGTIWINPNNQTVFNAAWCTESDLEDWMNGKGIMVKGETDAEKAKFMEYAEWEKNTESGWSIFYGSRDFHLFDVEPVPSPTYGQYETNKGLTNIKSKPVETLSKIYAYHAKTFAKELSYFMDEPSKFSDYLSRKRRELKEVLWGVSQTMMMLGVGYSAACNTPAKIENHAWARDLTAEYGLYLYYKENGMKFPDFEFIHNYKHKY